MNDSPDCVDKEQQSQRGNSPIHKDVLSVVGYADLRWNCTTVELRQFSGDCTASESQNRLSDVAPLMNGASALISVAYVE